MTTDSTYETSSSLKKKGYASVGKNVRVHKRASVYGVENIEIGDNVRIDDFTVIVASGPLAIGSYVSIHNFCFIGSKYGVELHDFVTLAPGVMIFSSSDDYSGTYMTGVAVPDEYTGTTTGRVKLEKHVIAGARSVILPDATCAEGSAIGALSMVKSDLMPWSIYAGVPAKKIKNRSKKLLAYEKYLRK